MCELFGISSEEKIRCNDFLTKFYSDAVNHPDGWGLAIFDGSLVCIEKEPVSATMSMYLHNRLTDTIEVDTLIAHIRRASSGKLSYKNSHPFVARDNGNRMWTLAHNGTIFNNVLDGYRERQNGECDSERLLLYLIDCINTSQSRKGIFLTPKERFDVVDEVMRFTAPENMINLMIYDGDLFYVHINHPTSMHSTRRESGLLFSTRPLDNGQWDEVPMNTLLAFHRGRLVYIGKKHEYTFLKENETENKFDSMTSPDIYYL